MIAHHFFSLLLYQSSSQQHNNNLNYIPKMEEENHSPTLNYSHLDYPSTYNNKQSIQINQFQQDLTKKEDDCEGAYPGQLIVRDQYSTMEQGQYQSLDYGQKIAFSHNILKDLVHMLDHKFPTIPTTSPSSTPQNIEKPKYFTNPSQLQSKNPKSNQKLQEKMLQVRDKLSEIITFINKQIDSMTPQAVSKGPSLAQFKEQVFQVRAAISVLPITQKELNETNQQQYQTKQQSTLKSVKIVIDKNRLRNAKEVYSQQLLTFHQLEENAQHINFMKSSLDRISEGVSGQTLQIKSNRISEINQNVSQVKSEEPKAGISLNSHEENLSDLDETGRIILTTINKKTISTTTLPKNHHKAQKNKPKDECRDEDAGQSIGKQVKKNKFWKQKPSSNRNKQSKIQNQQQTESKQPKTQSQISKIQQNRPSNQFAFNKSKVFQRNHSLNDIRRVQHKPNFGSLPDSRIKSNFDAHPVTTSQMKQSNIIRQYGQLHTTSNEQEQRKKTQQNNPEAITQKIHPRMVINHPLPSKVQQRQQSRLNLMPQPSNRPHSLPNQISRNILVENSLPFRTSLPLNIPPQVLSPRSKVIINSRPSQNIYPIVARNNTIYVTQKPTELSKSPTINRKIVFPQRSHLLNASQTQNNYSSTTQLGSAQHQIHRVTPTANIIPITNQPYQQLQHSKKPQFVTKFKHVNPYQLQKIIELSQQSIQNSIKKDNRSDFSLQTNAYNLYQSNASNSTITMNGKTLRKRGIQIIAKQHPTLHLMQ